MAATKIPNRQSFVAYLGHLVGLTVAIGLFGIVHAQEQPAPPVVAELAEDVYQIFFVGYSTLVVVGENDVLITDPAFHERAKVLEQQIARLTDKAVTKIIVSHEHYDHAGGTEVFPAADVICHTSCGKVFALDVLDIVPKKIDLTFVDYLQIDLGGKVVELYNWGPGDGDAATIVYVPSDKVVLTSDLYGSNAEPYSVPGPQFHHDRNFVGIRNILNKVHDLDIVHAVTTHSASTDPTHLLLVRDFYNDLYDTVYAVISGTLREKDLYAAYFAGMESAKSLKLPKYADWPGYDANLSAAAERMVLAIIFGF